MTWSRRQRWCGQCSCHPDFTKIRSLPKTTHHQQQWKHYEINNWRKLTRNTYQTTWRMHGNAAAAPEHSYLQTPVTSTSSPIRMRPERGRWLSTGEYQIHATLHQQADINNATVLTPCAARMPILSTQRCAPCMVMLYTPCCAPLYMTAAWRGVKITPASLWSLRQRFAWANALSPWRCHYLWPAEVMSCVATSSLSSYLVGGREPASCHAVFMTVIHITGTVYKTVFKV